MAKKKKDENNKFITIIILIFLILISAFLYARYLGTKGLVVKDYNVKSKEIPSNFNGIKILHISDLNYGNTTFMKDVKYLTKKVNEIKPDLIVFTGDLIGESYKLKKDDEKKLINYFNSMDNTLGKYAVLGDEDKKLSTIILNASNFIILNNSYDLIYNKGLTPIFLGGTEDSIKSTMDLNKIYSYYKKERKNVYDAKYKIILTHEGDNASEIIRFDKDTNLILAGHSHNGNIIIPSYGGLLMKDGSKKYGEHHYNISGTEIFVSGGIGTSEVSYRLFNKPSINLYRLKSE